MRSGWDGGEIAVKDLEVMWAELGTFSAFLPDALFLISCSLQRRKKVLHGPWRTPS